MTDLPPESLTTADATVSEPREPEPGAPEELGLEDLGFEDLGSEDAAAAEGLTGPEPALPEGLPLVEEGVVAGETLAVDGVTLAADQSLGTIATLFFYAGGDGDIPVLMAVDLQAGTLAIADPLTELFPTALSGLLAAEPTVAPWPTSPALAGEALPAPLPGEDLAAVPVLTVAPALASTAIAALPFTLVVGSDDKNFVLGTVARGALFGLDSDDLLIVAEDEGLAFGGLGDDSVIGGFGNDVLFGNAGHDFLEGGDGDDVVFGGEGDDILYGGAGANVLLGGAGADTFRLGQPIAYGAALVGEAEAIAPAAIPATIVDFNSAEGDRLDFSLIASQPMFAGLALQPFLSFVQVEADTHVQVTSSLGQTSTEAVLLNVEADSLGLESLILTAADFPPYK